MSHKFRIESWHNVYDTPPTRSIKVYAKSNTDLPLNIDCANRYSVLYAQSENFLERIWNFQVRQDDVWVVTMPKCGTTWMLELVWLVLNDLDYDSALRVEQEDRCPYLEYCTLYPFQHSAKSLNDADQLKSPRVIKSHLPVHILPKGLWTVKPKIIYVTRDPKDAGISFYHFLHGLGRYRGSIEDFMDNMLNDKLIDEPFWPHTAEFWKLRNEPNIYFTSFERMKSNLRSVVVQVGEFLNKPIRDEQMPRLLEHLSFQKMRTAWDNVSDRVFTRSIKVYAKSNTDLPLNIDCANRYTVLYPQSEEFLERICNFKVRQDDVWVITMPKCGTTWMLELVWLVLNDLDYDSALRVDQEDRCPFLEYCTLYPLSPSMTSLDKADQLKSPRVIKSHLPMHMLPKGLWTVKPKIIYVARDPKDAGISFYHFLRGLGRCRVSIDKFMDNMLNDKLVYEPFWPHTAEFWKLRNEPNIYFTSFERMKSNLRSVVLQIGEFLNKPIRDEQMPGLLEHLSFQKMRSYLSVLGDAYCCSLIKDDLLRQTHIRTEFKEASQAWEGSSIQFHIPNNPACNHSKEMKDTFEVLGSGERFNFMRKGEVGSYKEDLKEDMIQRFDEWTTKALKPYGVTSEEILLS